MAVKYKEFFVFCCFVYTVRTNSQQRVLAIIFEINVFSNTSIMSSMKTQCRGTNIHFTQM